MALHFSAEELAGRRARAIAALQARGLDGLLMFRQESMYYLTGYDTFGYVFFQCLYLGADGRLMLLTRAPDLRQAQHTSVIDDIRIWVDGPDAQPAQELRAFLQSIGGAGSRLGIEYDAYGLTAANGRRLDAAMDGFCTLLDASDLVSRLRVTKSPAELAYVRRAAALADDALHAAHGTVRSGAFEGEVLAAMQGAVFKGGGDYPGNPFIIGSGRDGLLCRYFSGRRHLDAVDQITLEFAGAYRHYHACLMRTIPVGQVRPQHRDMHKVCLEAMASCLEALRPGEPIGAVFDAYAGVCDAHGYRAHRLNACGYSLGTTFAPNWMDWPMFYRGNRVPAQPGMVFFLHMILLDSDSETAMCPGQTVIVGERGNEVLSAMPLDLVVR
ncbi:Xaa-Pro peptidase family protein [Vineibacter terrae]|uniref:Xaa-Pro peptidase family protein n=1 Tax=Vineibacter terrae TaxID=2586908 RepID=UPI002E358F0E|nr:Xaa-Pro peptidase family protein [Vineibacter terrae]HEX2888642.1 Xaa-Pro peptidase family protein [Vineibacter terrae]